MLEIRGREIRTSQVAAPVRFSSGAMFHMTAQDNSTPTDDKVVRINNEAVLRYLKLNDVVYFDDGKVVGIVKNIQDKGVDLEVKMAGYLKGNASVRFINGKHAQLPVFKKSDLEDLTKISQANIIDFLAIPYVATATDISQVKRALGPHGGSIGILAKIDMDESLRNFEAIMKVADGAIVVRKSLQWEFPPEKLMLAEKWLIQTSNNLAKPIMISSQLLDSTLENPEASR